MINFKVKLGIAKDYIYFDNIKSIINCPVTKDGKCIGVITDYHLDTDEAYGFLIDNLCVHFNQDNSIYFLELI